MKIQVGRQQNQGLIEKTQYFQNGLFDKNHENLKLWKNNMIENHSHPAKNVTLYEVFTPSIVFLGRESLDQPPVHLVSCPVDKIEEIFALHCSQLLYS